MRNISHQKRIFLLSIILIILGSTGAVTYAQVTGGDGFISQDENTIRAVDFRTVTGTVPAGVEFETEVIVANYGTSAEDIDLEAKVYSVDNTGNIGGVVEDEVVDINPVEEYNTQIKPGEHRRYNYLLRFDRNEANAGERYAVRITDTPPVSVNNLPPSQKFINISDNDSSTFDGSKFINREKADVEFIDMKRFKDKNSKDSTIPASTTDIPPVETDENNQITDSVTAGEGTVKSFQDIVSNEDISGSIQPGSTNSIDIGFSTDIDDRSEHYGVRVSYTTGSTLNMDKIELKLVDSLGQEVDENTTYRLSSVSGNVPESQIIHLSSKEVKYIQNQKSVNLVFNSTDAGSGKIDLYELRVVSSNDIFSLPEPNLNAFDMSISPTGNAEVGEIVKISGKIENTGSAVSYKNFRLYEENILKDSVKISDRRVINPGDTIDLTYSYQIQESGEHQFRLLDQTVDLTVEGDEIFGINPTISKSPVKAATGQDVEFIMSVDTDEESKVDSNVKEVRWYLNDQSTVDETISDPSSSSETLIERSFSTEGKKQVFMEYDYEADGRQETISRSTTIDIIGGPNPDVSAYYSDFGTISSGTSLSSINSASGIISATSCEIECGGNFVLFSDYPTTNGIGMLVIDRDNEKSSHKEVFYGTYEVGKPDGNYSTTDTFNSESLDDVRNDLDTGTSGSPSEALKNDIQRYRDGGDEDRIFIFTSAGNPKPAEYESEIYNQLSDLGADLDGGHTDSLTLQENSIWFFASQQTGTSGVPLFERYVPPNVDNPSLSEQVQLRDIEVSKSGTVPLDRKLYMSAKDTELAGSINDATITWEDRGDGTQDTGLMTGVTYSSQGTKKVELTIEDIVGNEVTGTFEYNVGFRSPIADINSNDLIIGQKNFIDSTGSFDSDGAIDSYVWDINDGEATLRGQNPSYSWSKIGENKVQLTVTDRNGNTDTTTESVEVSPEEPEPIVNINRLPASYDLRPNTPYYIKEEPVTHHPLNQISNEFSPDIWGGYSGNVGSGIQQGEGVTNRAADLSDTSDVVSIPHTDDFNTDNMTISIWVKPSSVSGESSVVSKEGVFDLRVSDGRLRFDVAGSASYQVSDSQIPTDVWSHITVSYENTGSVEFFVNASIIERIGHNDGLKKSMNPVVIGSNAQNLEYEGLVDDFRMYDNSLESSDVASVYSIDAAVQSEMLQNVFYQFGEERYNIQGSRGSFDKEQDRLILSADSSSGNNDTATFETEEVDLGNYDEIKTTYDLKAQRRETTGNNTTARLSLKAGGETVDEKVVNYREDTRSGVLTLDSSTLSGESKINISAKTFGSNRGSVSVSVFEIWGEGSGTYNRSPENLFSSDLYPSRSNSMRYSSSREGTILLSNSLPEGDIAEITIRNNNAETLKNHQVRLNIQHQEGMTDNFSDIKFFGQNGLELNHWVEKYNAGESATVWLKVSTIPPNSNNTLTMLYDSPAYSDTSDAEATFDHFDDFDTDTSSDWSFNRISDSGIGDRFIWESTQSRLKTDTTGSQWYSTYNDTKFDDSLDRSGFVAETRVRNDGSNAVGISLETDSNTNYNPYISAASSGYEGSQETLDESLIGITGNNGLGLKDYGSIIGSGSSIRNYHTIGLVYDGDSTLSTSYDRDIQSTKYTETAIDVGGVGLTSLRNIQPAYYDWFIVRKYAESQPKVVDKEYPNIEDSTSSLMVSNLSLSSNPSLRYETRISDPSTSGINILTSDEYSIDGSLGVSNSIYCYGIQTVPSCSNTGVDEGTTELSSSEMLGMSNRMFADGVQTISQFKSVVDEGKEYPNVLLNATPSTASGDGNRIIEYEWDTDGGIFDVDKVGEEIQLSLSDGVSREVELRVTDETGAQERTTINIPVSNSEPRNMDISAPSTAEVGEEIFISSTFNDDNKQKVIYLFDSGDKIVENPKNSIIKEFSTDGEVKVTAVGVDEYGQTVSATTIIDVQSDPPDLSSLDDSMTAHIRDTVVFDVTGNVDGIERVASTITTVYDASDISNNDRLSYRWVLPDGDIKQSPTIQYVPDNITGVEDSVPVELYVTNSVGQTSKKTINVSIINRGPIVSDITYENYDEETSVYVESQTCDEPGNCGSKVRYNGQPLRGLSSGGEYIKSFESVGSHSWTVPNNVNQAEVLVVAGGGGGGENDAGGGGAGGVVKKTLSVSEGSSYDIVVGDGGDGAEEGTKSTGENGEDSYFAKDTSKEIRAIGGGAGSRQQRNGRDGGSGGGTGHANVDSGGGALQPSSADGGYGNPGGKNDAVKRQPWPGAGGGGATEKGDSIFATGDRGHGGDGIYFGDEFGDEFGEDGYFGGGGGGGSQENPISDGGKGGGGNGGVANDAPEFTTPQDGMPNTGGGGGGTGEGGYQDAGDGGSGIVIVKYQKPETSVGGERGINLLALNKDDKPIFYGGYDVHSGEDYVISDGFTENGTVSSETRVNCSSKGCVTPELISQIDRLANRPNTRIIMFGDDQPMPYYGQGGDTVTETEARLYSNLQSLGAELNGTEGTSSLDQYVEDFQSGVGGWSSDAGTLTQKAGDWAAPQCKSGSTTTEISTTSPDVGKTSESSSIDYYVKAAAYDSWDDEDLVLEFEYSGTWNEVDRVDPAGGSESSGGSQLHNYDTYDEPTPMGTLDCNSWNGNGPIDVITFEGSISIDSKVTGARMRMVDDKSGDGPGLQRDTDEAFGIDSITIEESDYSGAGLQYRDMWYMEALNDENGNTRVIDEGWERRGEISGTPEINHTMKLERETLKNGDKINITVSSYVEHLRIGGELDVTTGDGSVYNDTLAVDDINGHTYSFNHTVDLNPSEFSSLPITYPIEAVATDDFGYKDNKSLNLQVGASNPNAQISTSPSRAISGEDVLFDASNSQDPQGSQLSYDWDFGDGRTETSETTTHSYSSVGNYTVTLEVENEFGLKDNTTVEYPVLEEPTVTLDATQTDIAGQEVTLKATASAYGDTNQIEEYKFYPRDGNSPITTSSSTITYEYDSIGEKTASVEVVDSYGQNSTDTTNLNIRDFSPNFTTCGVEQGRVGPSQSQCNSEYSGTDVSYDVNVYADGIQEYNIERGGYYRFDVAGAGYSSSNGKGAVTEAEIYLAEGTTLQLAVGQQGSTTQYGGGGAGATFVAVGEHYKSAKPLFVAGGAGQDGGSSSNANTGQDGSSGSGGEGGSNGDGGDGSDGTGGGGFYTDGGGGQATDQGGFAFRNGAEGAGADVSGDFGGFGAGGVSEQNSGDEPGGGGGYSGGGGAQDGGGEHSGGGGSYIHPDATNVSKTVGNSGGGYAELNLISSTQPNPRSCAEYRSQGYTTSGTYTVQTVGDAFDVYCKMNPDTTSGNAGTSGGPILDAYSFKYVQNGQVTRSLTDSNTCRDNKMRLFQPRGPDEYDAGRNYVIDDYGYSPSNWDVHSSYSYSNLGGGLGPLGVYIGIYGESGGQSNGDVNFDSQEYRILKSEYYGPTSQTLGADNLYGEGTNGWRTAISERFWVSTNAVDNTEPNGDYDAYDWLGWEAYDSQGYVTDYNDYPGGTYGYDTYLCWIPPK